MTSVCVDSIFTCSIWKTALKCSLMKSEKVFGFLMEMYLKLRFRIQKHGVVVIAMLRGTFRSDLSIS